MNIEQERAAFDAWIQTHCDYADLSESEIMLALDAYQAGRAAGIRDGRTDAYVSASRMEQMREDGL